MQHISSRRIFSDSMAFRVDQNKFGKNKQQKNSVVWIRKWQGHSIIIVPPFELNVYPTFKTENEHKI